MVSVSQLRRVAVLLGMVAAFLVGGSGRALAQQPAQASWSDYDLDVAAARALVAKGQHRQALAVAQRTIARDDRRWEGFAVAAQAYVGQGLLDDAVGMLQMALAKAPEARKPAIRDTISEVRSAAGSIPPAASASRGTSSGGARVLEASDAAPSALSLDRTLATLGSFTKVQVFEAATTRVLWTNTCPRRSEAVITALRFSSKLLISAYADGGVCALDALSGKVYWYWTPTTVLPRQVPRITFSPDEKTVSVALTDGDVVFDAVTGRPSR